MRRSCHRAVALPAWVQATQREGIIVMALMKRLDVFLLETSIEIDELLSAWDKNNDGYLTIEDCRSGLRELGFEADVSRILPISHLICHTVIPVQDEAMEDLFEFFQQPEQEVRRA